MTNNVFTKEELTQFNEQMLGRGVPNSDDGVGYNKADYSSCALYFNGMSDSQYADLAKRLVKYCNTQLGLDRDKMNLTALELAKNCNTDDKVLGVSIEILENETSLNFKYNADFISVIKKQPNRRYDKDSKTWYVSNKSLIKVLEDLKLVGADTQNAIEYAKTKGIGAVSTSKTSVKTKQDGEMMLLKFDYNKDIVNEIKKIDKSSRQWNPEFKFWAIKQNCFEALKRKLEEVAEFITT